MIRARFTSIPHKLAIRSTRSYANGSVNSPFPKNLNESGRQVPSPGGSDGFEYLKWGSVAAAAGILGYVFMINQKKERMANNPMSKEPNSDAIVKGVK